ncbi:hypothetical protein WY02_04775 [Pseudonocardia sp. AL041005-10]|nr:epoxide hydrolase N-terminal domain-containing protein [Pseudonocardia sp. AL041005-10]ALE77866.1 hypothetical protein WY02_04775 [Pseudonocardia sp. AL041005-10]
MAPNPFPVPQAEIDRLHARLDDTRRPDVPSGSGWSYDVPPDHLRALADHWRHHVDRRAVEERPAADSVVVDDLRAFAHSLGPGSGDRSVPQGGRVTGGQR